MVEYHPEYEDWEDNVGAIILPAILKLTPNNTIIIKAVKDSWTREEVIDLCANAYETGRRSTVISDIELLFSKWVESNL